MNIKELSFEFEGDFEQGQKIQAGISRALGEIGNIQNGAMGLPPAKPAEARVVDIPALPVASRSRRRRRRPSATDTEGGGEETSEDNGELPAASVRKSSGSSPMKLLLDLRKSGFFVGGKQTGDIVDYARAKGHTKLNTNSFTSQLASLCKKDVLLRQQQDDGTWKYFPGEKDE